MGGVGNCLDCEARRFDHDFAGGVITAAAAQNMERTPYRRLFNSENVRKGSRPCENVREPRKCRIVFSIAFFG